jgi:hypothetical protein
MLDGTLFFVKSARYGKPDKDFVRLFISFLYTLQPVDNPQKTAFRMSLEHISIHMKKIPILSIKRGIFIIFNQNTPFYFIKCKFLIFPMN